MHLNRRFIFLCTTAVLLAALGTVALTATAQLDAPIPLFSPLPASTADNDPQVDQYDSQSGLLVRRQYAAVDTAALQSGLADTLTVTFFGDKPVILTHRRTDTHANGYVWVGYVDGLPQQSDVSFSVYDGVLTGSFNALGRSYKIRPVAENNSQQVAIDHLNYGAFPPPSEPLIPDNVPQAAPLDPNAPNADDGSEIDVMVLYTPKARNSMGGTAASLSKINLAVAETNTGYDNSQITPDINLVYAAEINYTEGSGGTGYDQDLARLRNTSDGYMDQVHTLRNTYHADLVVLIIDNSAYCGKAYLMTNLSTGFASSAFSLVHHSCATGYYSFGHEMGHNMGSAHDRSNAGSAVFSYSYGHQDPNRLFRTVMAYNCPNGGCTRVNRYSNPDVTYSGQPTGIDENASNSAHNALSLNNVAYTVANFRDKPEAATPTNTPTSTFTPTASNTPGPSPTNSPTSTPTVTKTPYHTLTPTVTKTPVVTATPSTPYITAVCGLNGPNIVTLRGFQWIPNEEIDILVDGNLIYTLTDASWFWEIALSFTNPSSKDYLIEAVSSSASSSVSVGLPCSQVTATPTITMTPYATNTPTATPTNTPIPPTATPSTPYITAVGNETNTQVTLRGYNWPSDEDIDIFYDEQLVANILAGHGGQFTLMLTLEVPPENGALLRAVSATATHTASIQLAANHGAYLPLINGQAAAPPPSPTPTATATTAAPTPTATATTSAPTNDPKAYINNYRAIAGVAPVNFDSTLDSNCWEHARYMAENDDLTHNQNPSLPYASSTGQICAENGNAWLGGAFSSPIWQPTDPIDGWLSSVGHRLWLLYPTTPTFGYGFYTADTNRGGGALDVLSMADFGADTAYTDWPLRYPAPQQSGIPATDYAITLNWRYFGSTPVISTSSLTTLSGTPIPHSATTDLPVGHKGILVKPASSLPNDTVFVVTITGTYNGDSFTHSWQFATGNAVVP